MGLFKPFGFFEQVVAEVVPPSQAYYPRYDAYSGSVYLAIPGTDFGAGATFTQADGAWSDISGDINSSVSSKTGGPVVNDYGSYYVSSSTYFTNDAYSSSLVTVDGAAVALINSSDLPFGSSNFVVEAWMMPDEAFNRPPFHKPLLRSNEGSVDLYLDNTANTSVSTTAHRKRIGVAGSLTTSANSVASYAVGTWKHVAFVRNGSNLYAYDDGVLKFTKTSVGTVPSVPEGYAIAGFTFFNNATQANNENARWAVQDIRVSIGTDRGYVGGFTPPLSLVTNVPVDSDATAFLAATGITDSTQCSAVNELVNDLKDAGLWTKMIAIYPFVGGTADTHKFNLKNPQNTDAAYRLTFSRVTHSSNGITNLGSAVSNGGSYTHIQIATDLSQNDVHFSLYVMDNPTPNANDTHDMGAISGGNGMQLVTRDTTNTCGGKLMNNVNDNFSGVTDSRGFWQMSRTSSAGFSFQQNTYRQTNSLTSLTPPSGEYINIGALGTSDTTSVRQSIKTYAFSSIGSGLSTSEMDEFYTIVQKYQTTLGRNV